MSSITEHHVTTARLAVHYRTHGDADGLPMLLLHSNFATSRWWEPFLTILPNEILAVAPDLRGTGGSDKPDDGYTIGELAQDIAAFVDVLGWSDFDLVGHASGGAIAVELTLQRPELIRTLALVDPAPVEGVYTPIEVYVLLDQMRQDRDLLAQALATLMPTFMPAHNPIDQAFFNQLVDDAQAMAPAAFSEITRALSQWNRFADARALTLPTLLVWGDQDSMVERDAMTRTLIAIPGANNLEVLRNVGHAPMIEAPVALAERLIEFITDDFSDYDEVRQIAEDENSAGDASP